MATEVAPSAMAELTDLGKCLMKHEVGGGAVEVLSLSCWGARIHSTHFLVPPGGYLFLHMGKAQGPGVATLAWVKAQINTQARRHQARVQLPRAWVRSPSCTGFLFYTDWFLFLMA